MNTGSGTPQPRETTRGVSGQGIPDNCHGREEVRPANWRGAATSRQDVAIERATSRLLPEKPRPRKRKPETMNEAETRADHVDPALAAAGWGVIEGSRILREYPITPGRIEGLGRRGKPLIADYVLVHRNHKLAVVEAKAWDKPLTEGVGQAKDYAAKMAVRFAYSTNGQGIFGIDMETGMDGELAAYPSPYQLWALTFAAANAWRDRRWIPGRHRKFRCRSI